MRIAHLSDLHVLALGGLDPVRLLSKRLLGAVKAFLKKDEYPHEVAEAAIRDVNAQGVDHVVVTGDLTNLSLESEFSRARALLEGLAHPTTEVSLIPGNHDVYTHGAERASRFERFLSAYIASDHGTSSPGGHYPYLRLRGEVAIIGLSTAVATPPPFASGRIGRMQLDRLAELLQQPEVTSRFALVLLHHPPVKDVASNILRRLDDARAFRSVIARSRVGLVLYGHEHVAHTRWLPAQGGEAPCYCAGSTTRVHSKDYKMGRYNIYTVEKGELAGVATRVFSPGQRGFVPS
jgi:3',5'-cyclic AMP phosphodiesterase CpdA